MENIDEIIAARLAKESLSQEEINSLDEWLSQSKSHKHIYSRLETMAERGKLLQEDHRDHNLVYHEILNKILQKKKKQQKLIIHSIAASITLLIGLFFLFQQEPEQPVFSHSSFSEPIKPGSPKAKLTLEDGKSIDIEVSQESVILADSLVKIENKGNMLVYSSEKMEKVAYNTLSIPLGAEYCVMLPDNTKVFLNSGSELRYPVAFNNNSREVFLQGEAYFEVVKNAEAPFVVKTDLGDIKVLGTEFNMKCYSDETALVITLVNGKVKFDDEINPSVILKPEEQLIFEKENRQSIVRKVNVNHYTGWKDNRLSFQGETLDMIMKTLSRWYNVEVVFEDSTLKALEFSGNLDRFTGIQEFLSLFELGVNVKFEVKNRTVYIRKGN